MEHGRRGAIAVGCLATMFGPAAVLSSFAAAATDDESWFDGRDGHAVLNGVGVAQAMPSSAITVEIEGNIENASSVPFRMSSSLPDTTRLQLFIDRNPFPYIARIDFAAGAAAMAAVRIRIAESSALRVLATTANGQRHMAVTEVSVTGGGCSDGDAVESVSVDLAAQPIRARARMVGADIADLLVLVSHPMENGLRTTKAGRTIPAHFIRAFSVQLNGRRAIDARLGRSVAADPQLAFRLTGVKPEDILALSWEDSRGLKRMDPAKIVA